jgi:hypothetical protein
VCVEGKATESALVDVVASSLPFIGSRALWDTSVVREVVLARVTPATIGFSALGGALLNSNDEQGQHSGMHIILDEHGEQILVPLAPGLIRWVGIKEHKQIEPDERVTFQPGSGTVALDGEREFEVSTTSTVEVRLCSDGPYVVNVAATLTAAAHAGRLHRSL